MRASYLFTSESVSEGHPDKVSDQISDAILDAFLEKDVELGIADDSQVNTRLGCETLCTTNKIVIAGEGRGQLFDLQPDAKSQVTVRYVDGKPVGCTKVVVSTQHNEKSRNGKKYSPGLIKDMIAHEVESALPKGWMPQKSSDFLVNPTGNFVVGGPDGDCGLTGRKIIVDTYGGYAPHGGGAFSGKDPTKVDRSAAYAARYLAKNVVAS